MAKTFASLAVRNYRWWFACALVANVGTWMQRVAQDWLVLTELTDNSGVAVGVTTALQFAPVLFFSAWAGALADRFDRRKLLAITQGAQGVLAAVLGVLVLSGRVELWHVYVLAGLLGVATAFDAPSRQVFVGELVPRESLPNAIALNSAAFNSARLVGPAVAGILIVLVGTGWVFVINAASFAATIYALWRIDPARLIRHERSSRARGSVRAGVGYVRRRADILAIMAVVCAVSMLGLKFQITSAMMARIEFGKGAGEFGLLGSVFAIGSLAGALLAARRDRPRVRLVIGSALAFGVASIVLAVMPTYEAFLVACIPVGFTSMTMLTAANATIQVSVDPAMRGRVMALYLMVFLGSIPVGAPVVGWIAETFGSRWAIGAGAAVAILTALVAVLWLRRRWGLRVRYHLLTRPHVEVVRAPESLAA